jgi:phage terminase small subunit
MKLTAKQALFVQEYLIDGNATGAAERAGYSDPGYGRQLIAFSNVRDAIQEAQAKRSERIGKDGDWVVERLIENAQRAMQAVPVLDKEGNPTGEWTYQGNVANKALELLARHFGALDPRMKLSGLPKVERAGDAVKVMGTITEKVASGEITVAQGEALARIVSTFAAVLETERLEGMVEKILEGQLNEKGNSVD